MIPARQAALAQKTGRALAQTGIGGEVRVEVPLLNDEAGHFGKVHLMERLDELRSDFDIADRKALIDQAILTMDEFYVHKDLKWARHAVDAGCALRSLRRVCDRLDDLEFHSRVGAILKSLRDIHSVYVLPEPYRSHIAFLPFTLAACRDGDDAPERFLVTRLLPGFAPEHFGPGSEILTWNGLPMGEAVRDAGEKECAANDAALVALGVRLMTIRWLGTSAPPPASWVTLGYLDEAQSYREMRLSWRLIELGQDSDLMLPIQAVWKLEEDQASHPQASSAALDQRSLVEDGTVGQMFEAVADMESFPDDARRLAILEKELARFDQAAPEVEVSAPQDDAESESKPTLSRFFSAEVYRTKIEGEVFLFGHLRIHGFNTTPDKVPAFIREFRKLLHRLRAVAPDFLLLDVRSNPGGDLNAAESIVQFLTPKNVVPLPFQFRATRILERFVGNDGGAPQLDNAPWVERVSDSVANGQQYSRSGPLTSPADVNEFGQEYYGTVGLIFDAITYSSGDIFAAQFADLQIGPVIGVDPCTGGGGGNMIFHGTLAENAPEALGLRKLPKGARLHFAIRRCRRNGRASGELIEEQGVPADHYLPVSSDDLLTGDRDLLHRAAEVLRSRRRRRFNAAISLSRNQAKVDITTDVKTIKVGGETHNQPLSLFITVDGRHRETLQTKDGKKTIRVDRTASAQKLRIAVHELRPGSLQWLREEPLAVYTRVIPPLGED